MTPEEFPEANTTFAKDQEQYQPLPAYVSGTGEVVSCWRVSLKERLKLLFTGRLWLTVLTFNAPLQPQLPQVEYPFETDEKQ